MDSIERQKRFYIKLLRFMVSLYFKKLHQISNLDFDFVDPTLELRIHELIANTIHKNNPYETKMFQELSKIVGFKEFNENGYAKYSNSIFKKIRRPREPIRKIEKFDFEKP